MKIIFIEHPGYQAVTEAHMPPLAAISLASFLKSRNSCEVEILDAPIEGLSWGDVRMHITRSRPDIVAAGSITSCVHSRFALMKMVKEIDQNIVTIMGGFHVSLTPKESLSECAAIDYIVVGEGEETLLELLDAIKERKDPYFVKGIAYVSKGNFVFTGQRPLIKNMDELPLPDYSLVPMEKYKIYELPGDPHLGTGVIFSRGCKNSCTFCSIGKFWGLSCRSRSPDKMFEEVELLYGKFRKRNFVFKDTDFLYNKERTERFLERLEKSNLKILFTIMANVNSVIENRDLLNRLRDAGLISVALGVENFSDNILKNLDKSQKFEQIKYSCSLIQKARIPNLRLFTIWGFYDEDKYAWLHMLRTARSLKADYLTHSIITPFPGTRVAAELKEKGVIDITDYRAYVFFNPVVHTKYYSCKQLFYRQLLLHFLWWFHPSLFLSALKNKYKFHLQFVFMTRFTCNLVALILIRSILSLKERLRGKAC